MMISAIVLAAGLSSRMPDQNKLLLKVNHRSMIAEVVCNLTGAGIKEIIVVTGNDEQQIKKELDGYAISFVENSRYRSGMTSSIKAGILAATGTGYMICLGDMPFINAADYLALKLFFEKSYRSHKRCICVPVFNSVKGNPVIFSAYYRQQLLAHEAPEGCKEIVEAHRENVFFIHSSQNVLKDIDTPEQYQASM